MLVFLNLLLQEARHHSFVLSRFNLVRPLQEEVLEGKVFLLAIGEPLFFAHLIKLVLELFEHGPRLILLVQFVFHLVVEGEGRLVLSKVLTVAICLRDSSLELIPLLT